MGVDYVVIGFDMEVQPLVTHNACSLTFRLYGMSAVCIDIVNRQRLFAHMPGALLAYMSCAVISYRIQVVSAVHIDIVSSRKILQNRIWYHKIAECIARYK